MEDSRLQEKLEDSSEIVVYKRRWTVLAVFAALVMANALLWVTFAPISDLTQHYFGIHSSYGTATSVNMLANIFLILYAPGSVLGMMLIKRYKPRNTILLAGMLTAIGAMLRYVGVSCFNTIGAGNAYIIVFFGQAFAALAQPMLLNFPPALASIWFPVTEREVATTIGSMCSPIGNAIGQIIPIIFVEKKNESANDDDYDVTGMSDLMLSEFLLCLLPLIAGIFLFKDAPPLPPSQSTKLKLDKKKIEFEETYLSAIVEGRDGDEEESNQGSSRSSNNGRKKTVQLVPPSSWQTFKEEVALLLANKDYIILFLVFSIGVGFFNAVLTLMNQIVAPFGYSNDDAGTFGAVFILSGLVGAGIIGIATCCVTTVLLLLMLFSNNFWPLTIAWALLGMFVLPLLPVMMENCAECTYPVPEEVSMGILFAGCNILGLGFIFAIQYLLDEPRFGPPPLLPSNVFILGVLLVAGVLLIFYDGEYRRMKHEKMETLQESEAQGLIDHDSYVPPNQQVPDDSNLVRVTDGSHDNSTMTNSLVTNSANIWNSKSSYNSSRASQTKSQTKGTRIKDVLVHAANPPTSSPVNHSESDSQI